MEWKSEMGKTLMVIGAVLLIVGFLWQVVGRFLPIGKLPGDFLFKSGQTTVYFPIMTCIIISIVLSLLFSLFRR
jgi:hypothetical protein